MLGFLQAAQSGNYSIAAQYLQMSAARRQAEGEQTASQLNAVADCLLAECGAARVEALVLARAPCRRHT